MVEERHYGSDAIPRDELSVDFPSKCTNDRDHLTEELYVGGRNSKLRLSRFLCRSASQASEAHGLINLLGTLREFSC